MSKNSQNDTSSEIQTKMGAPAEMRSEATTASGTPQKSGQSADALDHEFKARDSSSMTQMTQVDPEVLAAQVDVLRKRLSASEEACTLMKPKDLEEASLSRFVRARDGDVDAAFSQMLSVLRWRREHKVDLILERDYEFAAQDRWGMAYWHGQDKFGRPILVIRGIRHDPTLFSTETTVRYLIWKLETKLMEAEVDDVVVIFDFINMGRHNLDMKLVRIMIPLLLNFYPERLGVCLVYPTLQIMWILWKMISKAFDEKTEKKFIFVREQKRDNKFLRLIPADQLQTRFGGTSTAEFGMDLLGLLPPGSLEAETTRNERGGLTASVLDDFDLDVHENYGNSELSPRNGSSSASTSSSKTGDNVQLAGTDVSLATGTGEAHGDTSVYGPGKRIRSISTQDCLHPRAFEELSLDASNGAFDTDQAMREYHGSIFDEDEEFHAFLDARDQDIDRFQVHLRYQVSHLCMDSQDSNSDDASSTISPASDSHAFQSTNIHGSMSDAGTVATTRTAGKRARIKRFFRRKILRRKGEGDHQSSDTSSTKSNKKRAKALATASSVDALMLQKAKNAELAEVTEAAAALQAARAQAEEDARLGLSGRERSGSGSFRTRFDEHHRSLSSSELPLSPSHRSNSVPRSSSMRRSSRRRRGSREDRYSSSYSFTPDKIKFVMEAGASMKRVPYEDPGRECNTWSPCSAARYQTRIGPDYKRNKLKEPSGSAIYDCVCMDVWSLQSKRPNIASYMQLPAYKQQAPSVSSSGEPVAPLPELLIVNIMMPGYPPTGPFTKKRIDGPGQSVVLFAKLSSWAKENPEDPSVQLWSRFVHVYEGDKFRERLKMITRLENPDECNLGRIERTLLTKYNGTPWMVRPEYEFHKGDGYFEICIDFHRFAYFALSNAMPVLDRVFNAIIDCALIIQAEKDQEMPERVLVCATIRCLNLKEAPEIDLVALTDESKRKSSHLNAYGGTSFIDRDGRVHSLAKRSNNNLANGAASPTGESSSWNGVGVGGSSARQLNSKSTLKGIAEDSAAESAEGSSFSGSNGSVAKQRQHGSGSQSSSSKLWMVALLTIIFVFILALFVLTLGSAPGETNFVEL